MAFDVTTPKTAILALVETIPGQQAVIDGAPESLGASVTAWVTVGDLVEVRAVAGGGLYELVINMIVSLGYVVQGAEATAESQVAAGVTEIITRVLQNRTQTVGGIAPMLNGSVKTMEAPKPAAMPSDYVVMAGQEIRIYPLSIQITQRTTIT